LKITIITVAYNSAATIADTLRSVAAQTHPDIEHIVIDGASTDATLERVRAHGAHVSRLVSEADSGIYHAMNKGLALATPRTIADIAHAAETEIDAVYGDLVYVMEESANTVVRYWRGGPFQPHSFRYGWMPPHPTLYVRRSALVLCGGFDVRLRIAADYEFMLRYLRSPGIRVAYLPKVLVRMRTGGASNRSLGALWTKSREDLSAMRQNEVGGLLTLFCKNARKLPQFFRAR
jgi:glycosyltransferase